MLANLIKARVSLRSDVEPFVLNVYVHFIAKGNANRMENKDVMVNKLFIIRQYSVGKILST